MTIINKIREVKRNRDLNKMASKILINTPIIETNSKTNGVSYWNPVVDDKNRIYFD